MSTKHTIACRDSVYGETRDALRLLPEAGITHVELARIEPQSVADVVREASDRGVTVSTIGASLDLGDAQSVDTYRALTDAAAASDVPVIFTSIKLQEGGDRAVAMTSLRELAERALAAGTVISMETHPPFGHNAAEAVKTLKEVNSAGLRFNYDTGNVFYYNENVDGIAEMRATLDVIASIHLKDTDGGFHSFEFPVFGEGVVDFAEVFKTADGAGFTGPYTFELEGPLTSGKTVEERHQAVVACVDYLKSLEVM